jgi:hypothetical protein
MLGSMQQLFLNQMEQRLKQERNENEKYSCTAIKLKKTCNYFQQCDRPIIFANNRIDKLTGLKCEINSIGTSKKK